MVTEERSCTSNSFEIGQLPYKIIGWAGVFVFGGGSIGAFAAEQYGPIIVFGLFVALGAYLILSAGHFILDDRGITHRNAFGVYRIAWQELQRVEVAPAADQFEATAGSLILYGEQKRFVVASPFAWSGPHQAQARAFLAKKLAESGLTPVFSRAALFKAHKNVRVSSTEV
jgi:hypothetical protein